MTDSLHWPENEVSYFLFVYSKQYAKVSVVSYRLEEICTFHLIIHITILIKIMKENDYDKLFQLRKL